MQAPVRGPYFSFPCGLRIFWRVFLLLAAWLFCCTERSEYSKCANGQAKNHDIKIAGRQKINKTFAGRPFCGQCVGEKQNYKCIYPIQ